jgi:ergothioneine biosynthesis protein EgtB
VISRAELRDLFFRTRAETERLAAPLSPEDQLVQAMPDASPTKWHRAHTTWFFETFVLAPSGIAPLDPRWSYLYNSYYEAVGARHARAKRGLLSRPTAGEVDAYRRAVDQRMLDLIESAPPPQLGAMAPLVMLGIAHEEQHQELILTDILAAFAENPLEPAYAPAPSVPQGVEVPLRFASFEGGLVTLGADGSRGFAFDNECPRHRTFIEPFSLAVRPITVSDVLSFVRDRGYRDPSLWLSDGWAWVQAHAVEATGHASVVDGALHVKTLHGPRVADPREPASHLSFYEADAIARYLGGRLPTEAEWEYAATQGEVSGQFREEGVLVPCAPSRDAHDSSLAGLFGGVWEWTSSAYGPYPRYAPGPGALGEYNAKFMVGQMVLRGGSCLSNRSHLRPTYRNFWSPATRFQMTGARVARSA